jgi:hypothetical protein
VSQGARTTPDTAVEKNEQEFPMSIPQLIRDRSGFPMIWLDSLGGYLHWLPVTKIQFEWFLCDQPSSRFDQAWYESILQLHECNARISPRSIQASNFWQALFTGVKPDEAEAFAQWNNDEGQGVYTLPEQAEWYNAFLELVELPELSPAVFEDLGLSPRSLELVRKLSDARITFAGKTGRTLADQMLLRHGIMEWVRCPTPDGKGRWGAFGQPNKTFHSHTYTLDDRQPRFPIKVEDVRLSSHGFRLVRRES